MFDQYPKKRTMLPPEYKALDAEYYKLNRGRGTSASFFTHRIESWMHRKVSEDVRGRDANRTTLEIGAGTLNHLSHETRTEPYDIVEPFGELYSDSPYLVKVRRIYSDIGEVSVGEKYDRIISIATLEHVVDLPRLVARTGLLLTDGGHLRIGIPSEGTTLWKLGWMFTSGLEFRLRYRLNYGVIMRHHHVNTAKEIESVLGYFFHNTKSRVFGVSKKLSFYQFFDCYGPNLLRCRRYDADGPDESPGK